MTFEPVQTELAWAAGFFDGEGNAHFASGTDKRNGHTQVFLQLAISQSGTADETPTVLGRFQAALGGIGHAFGPRYSAGRKPIWRWNATSFEHVQAGIAMLWRYLSPVKRHQSYQVLALARRDFAERYRHQGGPQKKDACLHGHRDWVQMSTRRYCRTCLRDRNQQRREQRNVK